MRLRTIAEAELERHQLRRAVDRLQADRTSCADCGRTPLTGEFVFPLPGGGLTCELCRGRHPDALAGEVVAGVERGLTVRRRAA